MERKQEIEIILKDLKNQMAGLCTDFAKIPICSKFHDTTYELFVEKSVEIQNFVKEYKELEVDNGQKPEHGI